MKLEAGESVQEHVRELTNIFNEMAVIGDPVDEEDRVVHLLASLPEEYSMLVTALEANEKVPAMETVTERLLHEERKRGSRQEAQENCLVGNWRGQGTAGRGQEKSRKGPMCFKCREYGHMKWDCPGKVGRKMA
jgi:hypothetical protein